MPSTRNPHIDAPPLHTHSFNFDLPESSGAPILSLRCTSVNLPGLSIGTVEQATPFTVLKHHGDTIEYEELQISFVVDMNFESWLEVFHWIKSLAPDQNFGQYGNRPGMTKHPLAAADGSVNARLTIVSPKGTPLFHVEYDHIFPTSIRGITFETTTTAAEIMVADATMEFSYYDIKNAEILSD